MKVTFDNIELIPGEGQDALEEKIKKVYRLKNVRDIHILRKSLDARNKNRIVFRYRVCADIDECEAAGLIKKGIVRKYEEKHLMPVSKSLSRKKIIIIGAGPSGLFCALRLIEHGAEVLILERGCEVKERMGHIKLMEHRGILNPESNVLFGEGGAGAYSDGKLTTRTGRQEIQWIVARLVELGAPDNILYDQKPHIGTDKLADIIKSVRSRIESNNSKILFNRKVIDIIIHAGSVQGVLTEDGKEYKSEYIVLATGHSARDTYKLLIEKGIKLEKKGFAVGIRIEHPAELINRIQYGKEYDRLHLPNAEYNLVYNNKESGRGTYTFCMCPGGEIINSSSENEMLCTNGMSYSSRNGPFSNSAILVSVRESDLPEYPLAGVEFQQQLEKLAYQAGGGNYVAPLQRVNSFLENKMDSHVPAVSYKPGCRPSSVKEYLPRWITGEIVHALEYFNGKMRGFISDDAVLIGVETRSSSPLRIVRNDGFQSISYNGLFPVGEGAGYAGGIISSAVDGVRAADKIATIAGSNYFHNVQTNDFR